ncbi:MAG: dual specificity protein phosphatase family protein [Anaerolineaceae bacterium]|nr:dual specificity protein phosphatase family protein [Anaerolineaceae bacterium]
MSIYPMPNITNLSFALRGQVYRSPLPFGAFDPENHIFSQWKEAKIHQVISLVQPNEWQEKAWQDARPMIQDAGMSLLTYPIFDFGVPDDMEVFSDNVKLALDAAKEGKNIVVHCNAGWGRTGLFITEMAIQHFSLAVAEAVVWVRQFVPPAVENNEQYQFLLDLHNEILT